METPILEIRLTDAETGAPIRYTPVWLNELQSSTNENGLARFDVPPATYILKVRSPLYEPYTHPITAPGSYEVRLRRVLL